MRAAVFDAYDGPLNVINIDEPDCPEDGVIIDVRACGVCRSDWHAWKGADSDVLPPHVSGHEFAGVVLEVGKSITRFKVGQRVTAPFILACGACPDCMGGEPTTCNSQHVIGFSAYGAFAERIAIPHADFNLVHLPDSMDFVDAAGMGCRVTTAFRALIDRAQLAPGEWLAVHGCGGVGLSAIKIASAIGAQTVAVDVSDDALELAHALGATYIINARNVDNVGEAIRDITGGGAHVSADAVGTTIAFHNSLGSLRKLGRHVQIGMPTEEHAEPSIKLLEHIYSRQLTILGTRGMAANRFTALFNMIKAGHLSLDGLVTKRISLEGAGDALRAMDTSAVAGVTVIDSF
ncbi:MAG: alcohol dehydrogenase [Hyphomicrobiales bacterium]|nr:MAG: alcohol dehydrogenase [Hyphomicrobiales bacterium]